MTMSSSPLSHVNQIVAVGSVDGVLTTAAALRLIGNPNIPVTFCQAFTVDKVSVDGWEPERSVLFVDLAVNNRAPEMTADFVRRIQEAGHTIAGICDEHDASNWEKILEFNSLAIRPESQNEGVFKSSGAVLKAAIERLGLAADEHVFELMADADEADAGKFTGRFSKIANEAVKSAIQDDTRRVKLARHLAQSAEPNEEIRGWLAEYEELQRNQAQILSEASNLGDGLIMANAVGKKVDMTSLMFALYASGAKVAIVVGEYFVPAKKTKEVAAGFGTNDKGIDLLAALKSADIDCLGGFAQKVNVPLESQDAAIEVVRGLLRQPVNS